MARLLLSLKSIALTFGGEPVLADANMMVHEGERLALVGRNGSGKSTLLKIAAGLVEPDAGEHFMQPGTHISYLEQSPDLSAFKTIEDYLTYNQPPTLDPHQIPYLMDKLGLKENASPAHLSGGEQRRAALARVLAANSDIILLDEPTNHLDLPAIEWLESELGNTRSALVMIAHDRRFLKNLSRKTLWLDRGETRELNQGFEGFETWRDKVLEEEEQAQHKLARKIVREEHWLRYGVTARRKRNVRRLKDMQALKAQHRTHRGPVGTANITVTEARDSGAIVIDAKNLAKRFDNRTIVDHLDIRLMRNDRLAIIGPNGAGKTTLINLLLGKLAPDQGEVAIGANVAPAMLDQNRLTVPLDTPLVDVLTGGGTDTLLVNGQQKHVTAYMKDFLFQPEQMRTPIEKLSGGERARLLLAKLLAQPSNLLVLDEPTNDLDIETLDLLEELVADYPGTVLLVSHDRDFVDRTATKTLLAEGNGKWTLFMGGYSDMLALRQPTESAQKRSPKPVRPSTPRTISERIRTKLSFKQKHALETLPAKLEALTATIEQLTKKLGDPDLYAKDAQKFASMSEQLETATREHETLENEWLELELLREELEG